jgi:hypothetical protein
MTVIRVPFWKYIVKLKAADEIKRVLEEKQKNKTRKHRKNSSISSIDPASNQQRENQNSCVDAAGYSNVSSQQAGSVLFYNPTTVAFGKWIQKKYGVTDRQKVEDTN